MKYISVNKLGLCLVSAILALGCNHLAIAVETDKPQVATLITTSAPMPERQLLGRISAPQSQVLSAQVQALVVSKRMEMGQQVKAGEILVKLDDREAQATVALRQADVDIAKSRLAQQQLEFERVKRTLASKVSSQAEYDRVALDLKLAKSQLQLAESNLTLAQLQWEKYTIRAPFAGALLSPTPVQGLYAKVGQTVTAVQNDQQLRIDVELSPAELQHFNQQRLWLGLQADTRQQPLQLLAYAPGADITTGMVATSFILPSEVADQQVMGPGQMVNLTLFRQQLNIPPKSIRHDKDGPYLFVVEQGKVQRMAVEHIGQGEQIIVLGFNGMKVGDLVSPVAVDSSL